MADDAKPDPAAVYGSLVALLGHVAADGIIECRIQYRTAGGGGGDFTIPVGPKGSADDVTPAQGDVLAVIEEMPKGEVLDTDEIVRRAGHLGESGRASGPLRDFVSEIARSGKFLKRAKLGWRRL